MNYLNLDLHGEQVRFEHLWLRDHCPTNFDPATNQRIVKTEKMPSDVTPTSVETSNGYVSIVWNDNHQSIYSVEWLSRHKSIQENLGHNTFYLNEARDEMHRLLRESHYFYQAYQAFASIL